MKWLRGSALIVVAATLGLAASTPGGALRPPAAPLVACDPYFSVWSFANRLTDDHTRHWTGTQQALRSMVRIDGETFRLMGRDPADVQALSQSRLEVLPTRTAYAFEEAGVHIELTFLTPSLAEDLDLLARPVTYLAWNARSTDAKPHNVAIYCDVGAELAVNSPEQSVVWGRENIEGLVTLRVGSQEQPVLGRKGDDLRIDWGHLYAAAPAPVASVVADRGAARGSFLRTGALPSTDDARMPRPVRDRWPVLAFSWDLGKVDAVGRHCRLTLAYDDLYSIELLQQRLRPYWRRKGAEIRDLLTASDREFESLKQRCEAFDREFTADLARAGGTKYSQLASLAYRQALAAHKLAADASGRPLYFPKENFSNGCISTVDVIYPAAPVLLLVNPVLVRASLDPLFDYVDSGRWRFPFAPHDLGTYPLANGQVYGGGEKTEENQMPVEESGNMLLLVAALAKIEGGAGYAAKHWEPLAKWAQYLRDKGLDPENQLCTDDFAGHLAHNANLSLKAILALGAFAQLAEQTGHQTIAAEYRKTAQGFAREWVKMADDGDHYRLAFDRPGTWSQKYNLVWDRLLGLGLFPPEVARKEIAFYLKKQNPYGLPLDNRRAYTKLDWVLWTATLAESPRDFEAFVGPAWSFANESASRVPLTDWYWTNDATQAGFQARSVVGGLFIKMLADEGLWKKWARR